MKLAKWQNIFRVFWTRNDQSDPHRPKFARSPLKWVFPISSHNTQGLKVNPGKLDCDFWVGASNLGCCGVFNSAHKFCAGAYSMVCGLSLYVKPQLSGKSATFASTSIGAQSPNCYTVPDLVSMCAQARGSFILLVDHPWASDYCAWLWPNWPDEGQLTCSSIQLLICKAHLLRW